MWLVWDYYVIPTTSIYFPAVLYQPLYHSVTTCWRYTEDSPYFVAINHHKLKIRITDSFSFDYADSPYHLITSSPSSYGLPVGTFSGILKSPQKFIQTSFLPENQCSLLNYAAWRSGVCGGMAEKFPPLPPFPSHVYNWFKPVGTNDFIWQDKCLLFCNGSIVSSYRI